MARRRRAPALEQLGEALERLDDPDAAALAAAVGEQVARERSRRGLSQRELAGLVDTTQSAIARLEAGRRPPRLSTLLRVANALDCRLVVALEPRTAPNEEER